MSLLHIIRSEYQRVMRLMSDAACDMRETTHVVLDIRELMRHSGKGEGRSILVQVTGETVVGDYSATQKRWVTYGQSVRTDGREVYLVIIEVHSPLSPNAMVECIGGIITSLRVGNMTPLVGECSKCRLGFLVKPGISIEVMVRAL